VELVTSTRRATIDQSHEEWRVALLAARRIADESTLNSHYFASIPINGYDDMVAEYRRRDGDI
jgi:hypothetical protein